MLRPRLSNIHILALGATAPAFSACDVGLIYRYYRLADNATSLSSLFVNAPLDGRDKNLGQGVDLLFNMNIQKEFSLTLPQLKDLSLRTSLGLFRAGSAYGTASGETAVRGLAELRITF